MHWLLHPRQKNIHFEGQILKKEKNGKSERAREGESEW
jgi:hypothetical protein